MYSSLALSTAINRTKTFLPHHAMHMSSMAVPLCRPHGVWRNVDFNEERMQCQAKNSMPAVAHTSLTQKSGTYFSRKKQNHHGAKSNFQHQRTIPPLQLRQLLPPAVVVPCGSASCAVRMRSMRSAERCTGAMAFGHDCQSASSANSQQFFLKCSFHI